MTATKVEDALATAVNVCDASRRVGWGKYFSVKEQADELSRDLNIAMGDREAFKRGLSMLYGAVQLLHSGSKGRLLAHLVDEWSGVDSLLDPNAVMDGRRAMQRHIDADAVFAEEKKIEAAAKRSNVKAHEKSMRAHNSRALRTLAGRYGFTSVEQMRSVLASWQKATNSPPIDKKTVTHRGRLNTYWGEDQ